jgi:hypothetical protein
MQLRILAGLTFIGLTLFVMLQKDSAVSASGQPADTKKHIPVIVELFTSEGCSSCPPADALLRRLESEQPVSGAEIIVLGEHVDYWNYIGWTDRFSSKQFTERQQRYADRFNLDSSYTPQMVINGGTELNGADESRARKTIANAVLKQDGNISITVSAAYSLGDPMSVEVSVETSELLKDAHVFLAITESALEDRVDKGENAGRILKHTGVVRSLHDLGKIEATRFRQTKPLSFEGMQSANMHLVAFVQNSKTLQIMASASSRPSPLIKH